jgi:hypothetical protein
VSASRNNRLHLSSEEMEDALIGDLAAAPQSHLAGCDDCQVRLSELEAPLASFRAVSLAWAERRSATMPIPRGRSARSGPLWVNLGAGAVTAVAVALAVPMIHHSRPAAGTVQTTTHTDSSPSSEELAQDNQMLASVDEALNTPVGRPDRLVRHSRQH